MTQFHNTREIPESPVWSSVPANATARGPPNRVSLKPFSSYNRFTSVIILAGKIVDCGFDCRVFAIFSCSTPVATAHSKGLASGPSGELWPRHWRLFY
jgi:hypothetical protein